MNFPANFNYLAAFCTIGRTLHFTRAAHELGVSQPNLSRQIRSLEESLGLQLLIRSQRHVTLSDVGRRLLAEIGPALDRVHESLRSIGEESQSLSGLLRIGSLTEVGQLVLFPLVTEFQKKNPGVEVQVIYASGDQVFEQLRDGRIDFGIVSKNPQRENLRLYDVFRESFVLVGASGSSEPTETSANFVTYRRQDPVLAQFVRQQRKALAFKNYREILQVNSHRSMIEALTALKAYAVLPSPGADALIAQARLRVFHRSGQQSHLYLAHNETSFLSRRHRAFRDHLLAGLKRR